MTAAGPAPTRHSHPSPAWPSRSPTTMPAVDLNIVHKQYNITFRVRCAQCKDTFTDYPFSALVVLLLGHREDIRRELYLARLAVWKSGGRLASSGGGVEQEVARTLLYRRIFSQPHLFHKGTHLGLQQWPRPPYAYRPQEWHFRKAP